MEKVYIGTKIIAAEPMSEFDFLDSTGRIHKRDHIMKDRPGYKVRYEDGYISWSPKETFERAYRLVSDLELEMIFNQIPIRLEAVKIEPLYGQINKSPNDLPKDLMPKE